MGYLHWFVLIVGALTLAGCKKPSPPPKAPAANSGQSARASVPLRVWLATDESDDRVESDESVEERVLQVRSLIERQWQASSERPLKLVTFNGRGLLDYDKCECDVVVFPAHLMGELLERQWLVELPGSLTPVGLSAAGSSNRESTSGKSPGTTAPNEIAGESAASSAAARGDEHGPALQPATWIDQARYGRKLWGLSLGVTAPVVMANFELPLYGADNQAEQNAPDPAAYWQAVIESLTAKTAGKKRKQAPLADPGLGAVCDRFLVLLASLSERDARFGLLFDPETLKARLAEQEFVEAAKVMLQLHQLNAAAEAMAGSYDAAWQALGRDEPCVSIGVPPLPTPEVDKVTSLTIGLPPPTHRRGAGRSLLSDRTVGWNSGHGLVASLTAQCRQTSLAAEFMRWLTGESNRNALARSIDGISASTLYAPGSSAWQAQHLEQRIAQQSRLPIEPRLPGSVEYRDELGTQLVSMLNGELEPEAAMKAAAAAWDAITAKRNEAELRASYEASLGL
ncbi:MAG: hypothetical protein ACTHK7_14705 [Aureliella sp.]